MMITIAPFIEENVQDQEKGGEQARHACSYSFHRRAPAFPLPGESQEVAHLVGNPGSEPPFEFDNPVSILEQAQLAGQDLDPIRVSLEVLQVIGEPAVEVREGVDIRREAVPIGLQRTICRDPGVSEKQHRERCRDKPYEAEQQEPAHGLHQT